MYVYGFENKYEIGKANSNEMSHTWLHLFYFLD